VEREADEPEHRRPRGSGSPSERDEPKGTASTGATGEDHKTSEEPDTERRYRNLEEWARERFGVMEFENRRSAQDYYSFDDLHYVGRVGSGSPHVYLATAFAAWE